jgi:hypothetical protein
MLCIVLCLSKGCEVEKKDKIIDEADTSSVGTGSDDETPQEKGNRFLYKLPHFSSRSKRIVIKLCLLFALDSFACSLASL